MATKTDPTRTRIENIKANIRSTTTCSASTVAELQELLMGKVGELEQKENARARVQSTARRRAGTAGAAAAVKQATKPLAPKERYILATEVANTTLKSLSDALKTQPASQTPRATSKVKPSASDDSQKPPRPRTALSKTPPAAQKPLQERSVSQITNSPRKRSALRRSSSFSSLATSGPDPGLVATAECARAAFAYLGTAEATKVLGKDSQDLQLENGILALIGKLVALGLDNLAVKELRVLKKKLDKYLGTAPQTKENMGKKPGNTLNADKETLALLLDFGTIELESPAVPIVASMQTYTLRIISRMKRPRTVEETWGYLKFSNPSAPANLIAHMAISSPQAGVKASRQLESLAQTIMSLCPSISSSDDEGTLQPSPDVVLLLQHLALKIRKKWWVLANHKGNEEKELQEPFCKCLIAFSRRSKLLSSKKYKMAESLYTDLLAPRDATQDRSNGSPSIALAAKVLSSLAQSAGLTDEALRWLGSSQSPKSSSAPGAKSAARLVRIATVSLEASSKDGVKPELKDTISQALDALSGDLSGSSSELDSLFMEVNALRRMATRISLPGSPFTINDSGGHCLHDQILVIIAASVHFTARFVAIQPYADADERSRSRYLGRISMVFKCLKSITDSVLVCCKQPLEPSERFSQLDSTIQDCVRVLHCVEEATTEVDTEPKDPEEFQSLLVKLSNAYWTVHLQLRKQNDCVEQMILAMERSIELIQSRSEAEKEKGLLSMKLEKLGESLDALERAEPSCHAFYRCLESYTDSGTLQGLAEMAAKSSLARIFEDDKIFSTIGRVMRLLHRSYIKYGAITDGQAGFFDNSELSAGVRGALLEWQLGLYLKSLTRSRHWGSSLNSSIQMMVMKLLDVYTVSEYPVRRQRTQILIAQLSDAHPNALFQELAVPTSQLHPEVPLEGTEDLGLERFANHTSALLILLSSMRENIPPVSALHKCFSTWESMLNAASSWQALSEGVDNLDFWIQAMQASVDYLNAKGEEYLCLPVLNLLVRTFELQNSRDSSNLILSHCALGLQFLRLGYTGKSGLAFAKAECLVSSKMASIESRLQWHLGYAEYLLQIGNTIKCATILAAAQAMAQDDAQFMNSAKSSSSLSARVRFNKLLADACYVYSLLAFKTGSLKDASKYAKQCVALNRRTWAALESKANMKKAATSDRREPDLEGEGDSKAGFEPLTSMRNDKGLPLVVSVTHNTLNGAEFWSLVPCLYRGLMQHSQVFANQGWLQEAVYVAEQAEKVASATCAQSLLIDNASCRAEYWAQSGRPDKAQPILDSLGDILSRQCLTVAKYHSTTARVHHANKNLEEEVASYEALERLLNSLSSPSYIRTLGIFAPDVESLTVKMSSTCLQDPEPATDKLTRGRGRRPAANAGARTTRATPSTRAKSNAKSASKTAPRSAAKATQKSHTSTTSQLPSIAEECCTLSALQVQTMHRRVLAILLQENTAQALELLGQIQTLQTSLDRDIFHLWVNFKAMLSQSFKELAQDFAFNTLPESTIAFPGIAPNARCSSEGLLPKRNNLTITSSQGGRVKKQTQQDFIETLHEARDQLVEAHSLCATTGSNHTFQQVSLALGQVTVLLSAVSGQDLRGSLHPLYAAYMNEIPKCNSLRLSKEAVETEKETMSREECLKWPEPSLEISAVASASDFQRDYIDIIPENWTTISLALNETCDELYITRYESGASPFVLRLPLARHASREMDEEEFTFEDGKRDFDEIIELSDFSTKTAKDMTTKEARLQWWNEREALDTRLRELLLNMENIWLGGFRGIFSQHTRQAAELARFRKSFENILNRNLPSRRKKTQQKRPILESRILELFIGLGDATDEELEMDEALMDLIYFVVDILQFNGERNAYDEIDFDAIVVETTDALRTYHSASQNTASGTSHVILILDKNLHAFPWESLPCLEKLSISRLPSLAALRERLLAMRAPLGLENAPSGHYISVETEGTSILNPSGDLNHTVKTIKPRLEQVQGRWTHIVNRAPTEKEFEDSLRDNDLVLYFGHGSGAQFVRSKAVRRLYSGEPTEHDHKPGCATTFLFGCSSVHLSENGIYEPSGMLASYLTAGAPAVVGMLWDVTDKDCDRLAVRTGELWGLWPELEEEPQADSKKCSKKSKGKGKVAQMVEEVESARGTGTGKKGRKDRHQMGMDEDRAETTAAPRHKGVGLDEAIREARSACVLRYLNGAAAVVYGIPVYLE